MGELGKARFESKHQDWETPDSLFNKVDAEFHFTHDVCASEENRKCEIFFSEENSCLDKKWSGVCWMNPPFKDMKKFVQKAWEERENAITVCLIPARTNTKWWHDWCMAGEVHFICGRPIFNGGAHGLPQPLALVVFGREQGIMKSFMLK